MTFSMTFFQGKSASFWNAKPTRGSMPLTGPPISRTSPADGLAPRHEVQCRRFAAAGRPDDGDEFAAFHRHVEIADRGEATCLSRNEAAGDVDQLDGGRGADCLSDMGHPFRAGSGAGEMRWDNPSLSGRGMDGRTLLRGITNSVV